MSARKFVSICALFMCLASAAFGQSLLDTTIVPLTVDEGFPLHVTLTEKFRFKVNEPVHGKVIDPVYAFDREVVPSGAEVIGKVTGFRKVGKWKRISTVLNGDFTPIREPEITFDTLVLPGGNRIPIETFVVPGAEEIVGLDAEKHRTGKGLTNALVSTSNKPAKELLKNLLWGLAPYHPQNLPVGTRLNAVLLEPLHFGVAVFEKGALDEIGSQPPAGCIASVRLITPLDSRVTAPGALVQAQLTEPLFSSDHRLIFPAGSMLHGKVLEVKPARARHHHGQLTCHFTTIEPPASLTSSPSTAQEVEGSLAGIGVAHDMKNLRITGKDALRIVESKKRFIGPAWAFVKAGRSVGASADSFDDALLGAYRGKFLRQVVGKDSSSFGLPGSITGAMVPPVGIGLGFFGAARSVYSNFLGRGKDIVLPADTFIQVRLTNANPAEPVEATPVQEEIHVP
jgi:hypothetical protein